MATIPETYNNLLNSKALAHVATLMPDGSPHATPVWFDYDGQSIRINTVKGRVKDRNLRRDPRVAVSITDIDDPGRAVCIRGTVTDIREDASLEHMNGLARRYRGSDWKRVPDQVRYVFTIRPDNVSSAI
jgi:PPOX class probable F420-dependent enzyme